MAAGRVGRPHGLDGSFHVQEARPELLRGSARVQVDEREREIVRRAGTDARPILRLGGCEDRDAAEALRGLELLVPRTEAPDLPDGEFWAEELEGCRVHDGEREVGTVRRLLALPSCEALEVVRPDHPDAPDLLIPLVRDAVRAVDPVRRRIDVDLAFLGERSD